MKNPTQCIFWKKPKLIRAGSKSEYFEQVASFVEGSHLMRRLLRCQECGQLYFFEFYEEIDWVDGEDPQYKTYIPVETDEEIELLKNTAPLGLLQFAPRLQVDFPKGAEHPTIKWIGK